MRAIAAIAVIAEHVGEIFPRVRPWFINDFNPGRAGVFAFFIVSGFVIPFSLERSNDLRKFWINRFFRLYPLYWVSLLAALLIHWRLPNTLFSQRLPLSALANVTMLQDLFHEPHAVGAYWTLTFELFFYALLSILFIVKLNRHTGWLLIAFSLFFLAVAARIYQPHGTTIFYAVFATATFFFGTWVYRFWSNAVKPGTFWTVSALFLAATSLATISAFFIHSVSQGPTQLPPLAAATGWLAGYALFAVAFRYREAKFLPWLLRLGQISYSLYLWQGVLLLLAPLTGPIATALLTVVGSPLLAWFTYHHVEAPAMQWGRRLVGPIQPRPF